MKILFVTSEAEPYAASGGLGDVMGALPHAIRESDPSAEVSVILPLYAKMKEEYRAKMEKVADISFSLSWRKTGASIFRISDRQVDYYFVEHHGYFDRPNLYGEYDDAERFAFFSQAVVEFMRQTDFVPDILHANDWQAALAVIYLKTAYAKEKRFANLRTVYTVHNIEYQGKFDGFLLGDVFGLHEEHRSVLEYDGCLNLMKGALTVSDFITTVSPHYAEELTDDFFAYGLAPVIAGVRTKTEGVINGIDYGRFSPETGGDIPFSYGKSDLTRGKAKNKAALQKLLGLPERPGVPLCVMITRLAGQKGIDLVASATEEILAKDLQFVVLGTGDAHYEEFLRAAETAHPDKMRALIRFDRALSKQMYAAADIFLMPSKTEPCGLAQMIACSYGTVPVVRAVGGLSDTIVPYGEPGANGFRFDRYDARELFDALSRATDLYRDVKKWRKLRAAAKASDFSWNKSAEKYLQIYNNIKEW